MRVIIVDDERELIKKYHGAEVVYLRTAADALKYLTTNSKIDILYLDHDLGEGGSGGEIANYLEERAVTGKKLVIGQIITHSMNPVGAKRMAMALEKHYAVTILRPCTDLTTKNLVEREI